MQVKVGDFGVSTVVNYDGELKKSFCGTLNYITPEMVDKKEHSTRTIASRPTSTPFAQNRQKRGCHHSSAGAGPGEATAGYRNSQLPILHGWFFVTG
ncbi:hypothetical protein niasHT_028595 [Heterodera trifolii]|uniref:Protein kinase domain-containing protein n=1 Tax=Heterodera trifolii TaxID=157864 RepID=A0ABD2KA51_9BILA